MLLAGIQAEFGLDPRLKHSGVTVFGSRISYLAAIFEGAHEGFGIDIFEFLNFVLFATFVLKIIVSSV
jgi:uncharacterized membrane protein